LTLFIGVAGVAEGIDLDDIERRRNAVFLFRRKRQWGRFLFESFFQASPEGDVSAVFPECRLLALLSPTDADRKRPLAEAKRATVSGTSADCE